MYYPDPDHYRHWQGFKAMMEDRQVDNEDDFEPEDEAAAALPAAPPVAPDPMPAPSPAPTPEPVIRKAQFCPYCGTRYKNENARFCTGCGKPRG